MAVQGEREQGGLEIDMCIDVGSMARDGFFFYNNTANCIQWGSSPSYTEDGLCRQTESHNSGAIAPQRNTEQAAIISATNDTRRVLPVTASNHVVMAGKAGGHWRASDTIGGIMENRAGKGKMETQFGIRKTEA